MCVPPHSYILSSVSLSISMDIYVFSRLVLRLELASVHSKWPEDVVIQLLQLSAGDDFLLA